MRARFLRLGRAISALRQDRLGLALVEFAYAAPVMLVLMVGGAELANYSITSMRISALALQVADNASRIGEGDPMAKKKVSEAQINDLLRGALAQGGNLNISGTYVERKPGTSPALKNKARIIISSLEPDPNRVNRNYIHWQRCFGLATDFTPQYGIQGNDNLVGMGPTNRQVYAPPGSGVIFVELYYRYEPIFPVAQLESIGLPSYRPISAVAAMVVRDDRDYSQLYNMEGVVPSTC